MIALFELLARDHSVARHVKRLHIHTNAEVTTGRAWFDTCALAGMVYLHHLELTEMPFHTEVDQLKFNNAVSESLPALRKLEYSSIKSECRSKLDRPDTETHIPVLQISGLYEIVWMNFGAYSSLMFQLNVAHAYSRYLGTFVAHSNRHACIPRNTDPYPHNRIHQLRHNPRALHPVL